MIKIFFQPIKLVFAVIFSLGSLISNPIAVQTQPSKQTSSEFPKPPDRGTPRGDSQPGGTRPETTCKKTEKPLIALFANNDSDFTLSEHPTFWFYVPYAPEDIRQIEFLLLDKQKLRTVYQTFLRLPENPGIIKVKIPSNQEYSLEPNKNYHWYLQLDCKSNETGEPDMIVNGWVQRKLMTPELKSQLESVKGQEYIAYRENGIWYDAITNLAELCSTNPTNLEVRDAWAKLLESLGQKWLVQEPFVNSMPDSETSE